MDWIGGLDWTGLDCTISLAVLVLVIVFISIEHTNELSISFAARSLLSKSIGAMTFKAYIGQQGCLS